jgi:actin-related protein
MSGPRGANGAAKSMANAAPYDSDDDDTAVVLDVGSAMVKAGMAGEDTPLVFPSLVGLDPKDADLRAREYATDRAGVGVGMGLHDRRMQYERLVRPVQRGTVVDWDAYEILVHKTFYERLGVAPEKHPVLVFKEAYEPKRNYEIRQQIMFETFNTPAHYAAQASVMPLYASGMCTGVVVDIGADVTTMNPVYDGYCDPASIVRLDLGGRDVTEELSRLLTERGHYLGCGTPTRGVTRETEMQLVDEIKQDLAFVSPDFAADWNRELDARVVRRGRTGPDPFRDTFELPDGSVVDAGSERFRCAELLFEPSLIGREEDGIHLSTVEALDRTAMDLRRWFLSPSPMGGGVVLSGGGANIPGLRERLHAHLQSFAPSSVHVKVNAPQEPPENLQWIGGSILASLSVFQMMWQSKEEYDESGPGIFIHRRF